MSIYIYTCIWINVIIKKKILCHINIENQIFESILEVCHCLSKSVLYIHKTKLCTMLTHFQPMFHFYTPWKHQKTGGFLWCFSGYTSGTLVENGLIPSAGVFWRHFAFSPTTLSYTRITYLPFFVGASLPLSFYFTNFRIFFRVILTLIDVKASALYIYVLFTFKATKFSYNCFWSISISIFSFYSVSTYYTNSMLIKLFIPPQC